MGYFTDDREEIKRLQEAYEETFLQEQISRIIGNIPADIIQEIYEIEDIDEANKIAGHKSAVSGMTLTQQLRAGKAVLQSVLKEYPPSKIKQFKDSQEEQLKKAKERLAAMKAQGKTVSKDKEMHALAGQAIGMRTAISQANSLLNKKESEKASDKKEKAKKK